MKTKQNYWLSAFCAVCLYALTSCNSDNHDLSVLTPTSFQSELTIDESKAQRNFAKTLSLVVSKEPSVRKFLKEEAVKQYDKDYDVFYPYVKDKVIADGRTFREILVSYSSEAHIRDIEKSSPLLTVMIPNLSAFGGFSVEEWEPADDQIAVTYAEGNENSVFYAEGDSLLSLPQSNLPTFPFLVVKSNERMKIVGKTVATRGGETSYLYDFANPAFDGTKPIRTRAEYYDETNTEKEPEDKPYLKRTEIDRRCIEAYTLFKTNKTLIDREYIYYNLSPSNSQNGTLNHNIREKLYKFKINSDRYNDLIDSENEDDPRLQNDAFYRKGLPSHAQIAKDLWTDGTFEIVFNTYIANNNLVESKIISVRGNDLFYISKFHIRYKHKTAFRHSKWWYTTTPAELKSRWVDVSKDNLYLTNTWDLTTNPLNIYIKIFEDDKANKTTVTSTYSATYVYNANIEGNIGVEKVGSFKLGFSTGKTTNKSTTITHEFIDKPDDLGYIYLNFKDPIIISDKEIATKGYEMYSLNTHSCSVIIAPTSMR